MGLPYYFGDRLEEDCLREKRKLMYFYDQKRLEKYVFRFLTGPLAQYQKPGSVATRSLAMHEFCALFEENRVRNKQVYASLWPKTRKIGFFK